ncbi:GTP cyclohydrolase FolE2 [Pleionea sp. CnH1-48]|uniref:GTP cyclohydrolase FolE2 n=1 Tax=Pleionea sp. CnH1-48 TaxID=2954494 RepID=UPI002096A618|nr:GTP cyclohydrolase FolE2 [Pleionea sp. CnH1-48]MCO7224266.1 GTP cyclohydrolase FolE2 [Pleionea sp. CnH1-48]
MQLTETLPDITNTPNVTDSYKLQWVGMEDIAVPITFDAEGKQLTVAAKANVYVSLDSTASKGIHMSRLHALLNQLAEKPCNKGALDSVLVHLVSSQAGICHSAKLDLSFDLLLPKPSLLSNETGFQTYPVKIIAEWVNGQYNYELKLSIPYSSTCPCSAALSRQLLANAISNEFSGATIDKQALLSWVHANSIATPHSQRSYAYLKLTLGDNSWPSLSSWISQLEETLGTPVQTMVKRSDEQEFARLNASNLMFCEDAARKIKGFLEQTTWLEDYWFKVEHQESLHAHNAVVIDQKFPHRSARNNAE